MNSVTIQVDQLIGWAAQGYVFLHVMYGLVTHYHSVLQVRKFNKERAGQSSVSPFKMCVLFAGRLTMGLPWLGVRSIIAPVGSQWHMTPQQIAEWGMPETGPSESSGVE